MANNCYNWVEFTGSKDALQKLKDKFKNYEKFDYFTDWGNHILDIEKDTSERNFDWYYKYGTKWWDMYMERDEDEYLTISGDTAWSPPERLIEKICKHYGLECRIEFEESGNDFGGYATFDSEGKKEDYTVSYRQWIYEQDSDFAMDQIIEDIEHCDYTIEDFEDDFKYMEEEDVNYIKEFVEKLSIKSKQI